MTVLFVEENQLPAGGEVIAGPIAAPSVRLVEACNWYCQEAITGRKCAMAQEVAPQGIHPVWWDQIACFSLLILISLPEPSKKATLTDTLWRCTANRPMPPDPEPSGLLGNRSLTCGHESTQTPSARRGV